MNEKNDEIEKIKIRFENLEADKKLRKIKLYRFCINGKDREFKSPAIISIESYKDCLIFSIERGDLILHTIANIIDEGLRNVFEILDEDWEQYTAAEFNCLSEIAIGFRKYLESSILLD